MTAAAAAMTPKQRAIEAVKRMDAEQKHLFLRYGGHRQGCAWRKWHEQGKWIPGVNPSRKAGFKSFQPEPPDCSCGWIEALGAACGGTEE